MAAGGSSVVLGTTALGFAEVLSRTGPCMPAWRRDEENWEVSSHKKYFHQNPTAVQQNKKDIVPTSQFEPPKCLKKSVISRRCAMITLAKSLSLSLFFSNGN
jgi:hypothetical protein